MKKGLLKRIIAITMVATLCVGCGLKKDSNNDGGEEKTTITIGGTSISEITYQAIKPEFEKLGYTTKFVSFDSNPVVLQACNSGDVDIALGQHLKFVKSFNESNSGDLDMAKPYGYYTGIGLYSNKYESVEEIPDGAQIAIMNDAMNMDIVLKILEENGLIELNPDLDTYTVADIVNNPKNIKVIDMDQAQTVTALEDVDATCVFFTHMSNAGKDPAKYIARDQQLVNYPMGVIVKDENVESKWATDFAKCFKIDSVQEEINKAFPGVFEFYTSDDQVKE